MEHEPEEKLALVLDRYESETWLDAAMRMAEKTNLRAEVKNSYNVYIEHGNSEEKSAWCACYDWDCLELLKL